MTISEAERALTAAQRAYALADGYVKGSATLANRARLRDARAALVYAMDRHSEVARGLCIPGGAK